MLEDLILNPRLDEAAPPAGDSWARCLSAMLDEVDYGMMLFDSAGHLRLMNHAARRELDDSHPLRLVAGQLRARTRDDGARLQDAFDGAVQGSKRQLLLIGDGDARISLAVVPLGPQALEGAPATMLLLGRRRVAENLSVQFFARSRKLTPAETRVLEALCAGVPPTEIAVRQGVRISTVRTQIGGLREKTGARSIRALVRMVSVLPPVVPALRLPFDLPGTPPSK